MRPIDTQLIAALEPIEDPQELLKVLFEEYGSRAAIGTSGQLTGVVLVDLAAKALESSGKKPRVFTIDTERLFPETYQLFDAVEKKYGLPVERIRPDPIQVQTMVKENGEFLFFDSKEKQEFCCNVRKVLPNQRVLDTIDVWVSGLRAEQSAARAATPRFEIVTHGPDKRPILKVSPLVRWTEKELRAYAAKHDVPIHALLDWQQEGWYYESLGCIICTTPIGPTEPRRAGRWRWFNHLDTNKECGIHQVKKDEV